MLGIDLMFNVVGAAFVIYIIYKLFFSPRKKVIAFDMGGVFTTGDFWTEEVRERAGMRALVKKLRKKYRVVILSNNNSEAYGLFDRKFGFSRLFDDAVVSGRVGVKKPDPKIFQILLGRFGVKGKDCAFIDDNVDNLVPAKQMGINTFKFDSIQQLVPQLRKAGFY